MANSTSVMTAPALGVNINNLIPYNVIIISTKVSEGKLLKQYLQSDLFNIVNIYDKIDDSIFDFSKMQNSIDLVCINLENNKDGLNLAKTIINISSSVITVFISSLVTRSLIKEIKGIGINSLLLKPYSKIQVYEKFAEILGRDDLMSKKLLVNVNSIDVDLNSLSIPPIPTVLINVMNFNESKSINGSLDLEKVILPDKALTIDIIKISNSSFYGRSGSIKNLKDAITLLGMKTIKNLVILQAKKKLNSSLKDEIYVKHLTNLPIYTSLIALDLLNPLGLQKIENGLFSFCIFRKIGMLVLAQNFPKRYMSILDKYEQGLLSIFQLEKHEFKIDSIEIGLRVFKQWKFPKEFMDVIQNQRVTIYNMKTVNHIDRVCYLAEVIAKRLIGIPLTKEEITLELVIFEYYNAPEIARFAFNESYFEILQEHPFFM